MRHDKKVISVFTVLLLALMMLFLKMDVPEEEVNIPVSFLLRTENGEEKISAWKNDEGEYLVFLPGYARMDQLKPLTQDVQMIIDNVSVTESTSFGQFFLETAYPIHCKAAGKSEESIITFLQTGEIPVMYIDVRSGTMDYIHLEKGNEEPGRVRLYETDGSLNHSGELISVKGRGNSSWSAEKKPYSLELHQESDLLNMGSAQRWILLAEGYYSCINVRNKIVYDFAQKAGLPYTPDCRWVNLYLNGEYAGLYLLSERNEIHPQRVDIAMEDSFLVSMEWDIRLEEQKYPHILTDSGQALRVYHSSQSIQSLRDHWQSVENAILAEDGIDPESGMHWQELIDLDSWARKYLLEELFGNHDGGSFSQFFYYDGTSADKKIHAGPIWDYDLAMGGYEVWLKYYTNYLIMNREYKEDGLYTPWFHALYEKEEFRDRVLELYEDEFLPLMDDLLEKEYDSHLVFLQEAHRQDACRWGHSWEAVQEEIAYIRQFLEERMAFLTDFWFGEGEYHIVRVDPGRKDIYGHFAVKRGECLPELPAYDDIRGLGWFVVGTDEPFDVTQPIYEDVCIYVKKAEFQIPKIHYVPVFTMIMLLPVFLIFDRYQIKKNGRMRNDPAKIK